MSYNIDLIDKNNEICRVNEHKEGGTYCISGSDVASLNVTYNYSCWYDFKLLDGKSAKDMINSIEEAVIKLGTKKDSDYWKATAGNAGYALNILLQWAKQFPDAKFEVS